MAFIYFPNLDLEVQLEENTRSGPAAGITYTGHATGDGGGGRLSVSTQFGIVRVRKGDYNAPISAGATVLVTYRREGWQLVSVFR